MFARAAETVELLAIFESERDAVRFRKPYDGLDAFAVAAARDDDAVQRVAGGERFFDGMESRDPVHARLPGRSRLVETNGGDGVARDGFAAADFADAFVGLRLQTDLRNCEAE